MFTPGATMSGFTLLSRVGPRLENHARNGPWAPYCGTVDDQSAVAPTVIACTAEPGEVIVPGRSPPFPAAAMTIFPFVTTAASTACDNASRPSEGTSDPRLSEITSTLGRLAHHWIPRTPSESSPEPVASRTFAAERAAAGATPFIWPAMGPGPTPSPTAIDATCVPWPWSSYGVGLPLTSSTHGIGAFESSCSWFGSTPVSTTQTSVP